VTLKFLLVGKGNQFQSHQSHVDLGIAVEWRKSVIESAKVTRLHVTVATLTVTLKQSTIHSTFHESRAASLTYP
jgi:hypothetical protein